MKQFAILKMLKTKNKIVFEAETAEEIKTECERLNLREFSKPYILTHLKAEDIKGNYYALTQRYFLPNGESLPVSPDDLIKVFNL